MVASCPRCGVKRQVNETRGKGTLCRDCLSVLTLSEAAIWEAAA